MNGGELEIQLEVAMNLKKMARLWGVRLGVQLLLLEPLAIWTSLSQDCYAIYDSAQIVAPEFNQNISDGGGIGSGLTREMGDEGSNADHEDGSNHDGDTNVGVDHAWVSKTTIHYLNDVDVTKDDSVG